MNISSNSAKILILILRRDHKKNFLWASRLWVGRRKEPILGYVPKNYERKNSGSNGLSVEPSFSGSTVEVRISNAYLN